MASRHSAFGKIAEMQVDATAQVGRVGLDTHAEAPARRITRAKRRNSYTGHDFLICGVVPGHNIQQMVRVPGAHLNVHQPVGLEV